MRERSKLTSKRVCLELYLQIAWFHSKAGIYFEIIVPLKKKIKRVEDM